MKLRLMENEQCEVTASSYFSEINKLSCNQNQGYIKVFLTNSFWRYCL